MQIYIYIDQNTYVCMNVYMNEIYINIYIYIFTHICV